MAAPNSPSFNQHVCQHCQSALQPPFVSSKTFCSKPVCQQAMVREQLLEQQLKKKALDKEIEALGDSQLSAQPPAEVEKHIIQLPNNPNADKVEPLSNERKRYFIEHLAGLIETFEQSRQENRPYSADSHNVKTSDEQNALIASACATCKGYCCLQGQNHAFLDNASLRNILAINSLMLDDLTALYSQYVPKSVTANGCVFQTPKGCSLPNNLRSHTCNRYLCRSLAKSLYSLVDESEKKSVIFFGAVENDSVISISVFP